MACAAEEKGAAPVLVGAVKVQTDGPKGAEAAEALVQSLDYGFQAARIAYNASHKDQLALREEKDGDAVIKSLVGRGAAGRVPPVLRAEGRLPARLHLS